MAKGQRPILATRIKYYEDPAFKTRYEDPIKVPALAAVEMAEDDG